MRLEQVEYEKLRDAEDRMWWFAAIHGNLLMLCRRFWTGGTMLDAGCGTGGLLARLARELPEASAIGLDANRTAAVWAAQKSGRPVCAGSVNALPFADRAFDAIVSVDVLCHRDVDEKQALAQFRRCLVAGGVLILNLPAYSWLMSRHDAAVYNGRRYTRRQILGMLRKAGFRPIFASYWNMLLFPAMVAARKFWRGHTSDVAPQPPFVDTVGRAATSLERWLLRAGLRLPFGGSVLAVAAKPE
jgi:SAM-dependent methyltransferase